MINYSVKNRVQERNLRGTFDEIYDFYQRGQVLSYLGMIKKLKLCDRVLLVDYVHQTLNQPELAFEMARKLINPTV